MNAIADKELEPFARKASRAWDARATIVVGVENDSLTDHRRAVFLPSGVRFSLPRACSFAPWHRITDDKQRGCGIRTNNQTRNWFRDGCTGASPVRSMRIPDAIWVPRRGIRMVFEVVRRGLSRAGGNGRTGPKKLRKSKQASVAPQLLVSCSPRVRILYAPRMITPTQPAMAVGVFVLRTVLRTVFCF
jgi:hypothetical protein